MKNINLEVKKEIHKYKYVLVFYSNDGLESCFSNSDLDLLDYVKLRKIEYYEIYELIGK